MKSLFFFIFSYLLVSSAASTDIVFLIDSSKSINMFNNEHCHYNSLIQNFTSDLVYELRDCDINYASVQYNYRGVTDYGFSNNNSYVYNKMKNYDFKYGAPTLIHKGLDKVVDLYDLHNYTKQIFIILITDGETLNEDDFHKSLEKYPFNSDDLNNILIKIGTYVTDNTFILDEFSNNSTYNHLSCTETPLNTILNCYDFCGTTSSTSLPNTTITSSTSSTILPNTTITSSTSLTSLPNTTTSTTTTSTTTTSTSNLNSWDNLYKILIIIIAGIIFLFSITAMVFLYCNNTNKTIRDNEEPLNDFYNYRNEPRIIHNSMYSSVTVNPDEYIEVDDDASSLDDDEDINRSYNYLRNGNSQTTDF